MESGRPAWQRSDCPAWCTREHLPADHEDDRYHQSEATIVPVVRLLSHEGSQLQREAVADEVAVLVLQHQDDSEWWLSLSFAQQSMVYLRLSHESAERLTRSLHAPLGQLGL